jgi:hypothetical protein
LSSKIKLDYDIAKPLEPGSKKKAVITDIREMKAGDIFGAKARDPERILYAIYANIEGIDMRIATMAKPDSKTISSRHKLARFKERYGAFPEKGMKVQAETNKDGYWNLVI